MSKYYEWDGFENIYLEDSYVLGIKYSGRELSFIMELVLTENHPMYSPPKESEQYCYRNGEMIFKNVSEVKWINRSMQPNIDFDGAVDYGNIDSFELSEGGYHLEGDWGEVIVYSSEPELELKSPACEK